MRIITGIARGRKLKCPEGMNTRPTTDKVKGSVFNIIQNKIFNAEVLDLFGGTGNLGLECISRGARQCTFVERDKNTYKFLLENITALDFGSKAICYNREAINSVEFLSEKKQSFDIIFLDPPYGKNLVVEAIEKIYSNELLKDGGIIISEYDQNDAIPDNIGDLTIYRSKKYGRIMISFWSKEDSNE